MSIHVYVHINVFRSIQIKVDMKWYKKVLYLKGTVSIYTVYTYCMYKLVLDLVHYFPCISTSVHIKVIFILQIRSVINIDRNGPRSFCT